MLRYKTVVTDYEGMQGILDAHAMQGWRLFSVSADTWRKSIALEAGMDHRAFEELSAPGDMTQEYSASYYLVVFQREDNTVDELLAATVEEPLSASAILPGFEE